MKRNLGFLILPVLLIIIIESAICHKIRFKNNDNHNYFYNKNRRVLPTTVFPIWKIKRPTPIYSVLTAPDICPTGSRMEHRLSRCIRVSEF